MSVKSYAHYKKVLVEGGALGLYPLRAALMDSAYSFSSEHRTLSIMQALIVDDVGLSISTSFTQQGQYTVWLDGVSYKGVNAEVSGIVIYVDGFITGSLNPLLWYCDFPASELKYTDLLFKWQSPIFTW
jgi:hypothetical protein